MRLLLDENLPRKLKYRLSDYQVNTVPELGWQGMKNGALLQCMLDTGINVLLTFDQGLAHQQNYTRYPLAVLILRAKSNTYAQLEPLIPAIRRALSEPLAAGPHYI